MSLLILGNSRIARKRILPALDRINTVQEIDIASRSFAATKDNIVHSNKLRNLYSNFREALEKTTAKTVYVSTRNSEHFEHARLALESGRNVLVDKPICMTLEETKTLVELSKSKGLVLAEFVPYLDHAQIKLAKDKFAEFKDEVVSIIAHFTIPSMSSADFRSHKEWGGGSLLDQGIYAMSPARYFYGQQPDSLAGIIHERTDIDLGFSFTAKYPGNRMSSGIFSFNSAYTNELKLIGKRMHITLERVFSPPPDQPLYISITQNTETIRELVPAHDAFQAALARFFEDLGDKKKGERWTDLLLHDAMAVDLLKKGVV